MFKLVPSLQRRPSFLLKISKLTDKVVVLSGPEFQSAGLRSERTERDGKVHQLVGFITNGNDARIGIGDAARVVLLFGHVVDDVLFRILFVRSRRVHGTNDVHLVVLERNVVLVDVDDVVRVVYPETVSEINERKMIRKMVGQFLKHQNIFHFKTGCN
jgi:hypothetical protein